MKTKFKKLSRISIMVLVLILLQSCKEYLETSAIVALAPEAIFGLVLIVVFVLVFIGAIIKFLSGDK
jgi:ABC-type transporter Mla maintaining outer membrane lipid asymmetry permease subunit MlaE